MGDLNKGYIFLYRCLLDCSIWEDQDPFDRRSAWIDLLLLCNHRDKQIVFNGEPITIGRGQYLTSVRKLAERWHWSVNRTARYLKLLEELQMVKKDSDNYRTLLTIENYEVFQDARYTNGYTDEDTDKHADKDTDESQTKKVKKEKNVINNKARPQSVEEVAEYCKERQNKVDPQKWWDYYTANGWKIGKNPMKDWKASVRTWEKNNYDQPKKTNQFTSHEQRPIDQYEEFIRSLDG